VFCQSLGDDHSVKWAAVMKWQRLQFMKAFRRNVEAICTDVCQLFGQQLVPVGEKSEIKPFVVELLSYFPQACH